jgi:hypothetical protein
LGVRSKTNLLLTLGFLASLHTYINCFAG